MQPKCHIHHPWKAGDPTNSSEELFISNAWGSLNGTIFSYIQSGFNMEYGSVSSLVKSNLKCTLEHWLTTNLAKNYLTRVAVINRPWISSIGMVTHLWPFKVWWRSNQKLWRRTWVKCNFSKKLPKPNSCDQQTALVD